MNLESFLMNLYRLCLWKLTVGKLANLDLKGHSDLFSSWPHSIWWKSSRGLKEQGILKVADQTDELKLNSWCGFKKYFLCLRKVFKSFSTTSMPPVEAFLHQPVTPYCLLAPVPRQPLYCLLTILLHPALCQYSWLQRTHGNLFSH